MHYNLLAFKLNGAIKILVGFDPDSGGIFRNISAGVTNFLAMTYTRIKSNPSYN